jgi:RHH-type rel operon transcriptional repressor/antitoxin RelB
MCYSYYYVRGVFAMLSVRLSKSLEAKLDALAERTHRAKSYYVKKALTEYLENQEEYEIAAAAYKEYLESGKKSISFEELMKKNGLLEDANHSE